VLLHLLFEHQSQVEVFMALRLLEYMMDIWRAFQREHGDTRRLPPILPIVLHHSERGWTTTTRFEELLDLGPEARVDLENLGPQATEEFVTLGERLIEQGRQEGLQKGLQKGLRRVVLKQLELKFGPLATPSMRRSKRRMSLLSSA